MCRMSFLALATINEVERKETLDIFDRDTIFLRQIHVSYFICRCGQAPNPDEEFTMKVSIPWNKEVRPVSDDVALL